MGQSNQAANTTYDRGLYENSSGQSISDEGIELLERLYYDTAQQGSPLLRAVQELAPPSHILFGTDLPFQSAIQVTLLMKALSEYEGFDEPALVAVERDHALELFPRLRGS